MPNFGPQMPFGGHPPHQARGLKAHGRFRPHPSRLARLIAKQAIQNQSR
jgi:hypothetical protein